MTDAGFAALFRDNFCRIFDKKRKILGVVHKLNGTYRVLHEADTAAAAIERLSVDELHRRMGHIAPDAAKRLVKDG
ncbi:hypothetical protein DFH06DRAFT_1065893, partial [Mycena polygramma]